MIAPESRRAALEPNEARMLELADPPKAAVGRDPLGHTIQRTKPTLVSWLEERHARSDVGLPSVASIVPHRVRCGGQVTAKEPPLLRRMARGRFDVAAVRQATTIAGMLRSVGEATGTRGRTRCPIHRGRNPQAFRYSERNFCCFSCGEHGDVVDLAERLLGLDFRSALAHCATLGGVAPVRADAMSVRLAIEYRARLAAERAAQETRWHDEWAACLGDLREAQAGTALFRALVRDDREEQDTRTTTLLDELGDAYLAEQVAELRLDDVEAAWRFWREAPPPPVQSRPAVQTNAFVPLDTVTEYAQRRRAAAAARIFGGVR